MRLRSPEYEGEMLRMMVLVSIRWGGNRDRVLDSQAPLELL
jgi:hypothetical protein